MSRGWIGRSVFRKASRRRWWWPGPRRRATRPRRWPATFERILPVSVAVCLAGAVVPAVLFATAAAGLVILVAHLFMPAANVVYLGLAFGGGLFVPPQLFPGLLDAISQCLVSRHIAELAWKAVAGAPWSPAPWLWIACYAVAGFLLAGWGGYRRDEGERYR